jgi:hypothetical protein
VPKYQIEMTVNYSGEVYADNEDEAREQFIRDREHRYYESVESESIEEIDDDEEGDDDDA